MSFIFRGEFWVSVIEVNTLEVVFVFQIEMVVDHDAFAVRFGEQRQQTFRVDRFRFWLAQVQQFQSFVKERVKNLVFFDEEVRRGH